jgi:hypothetical protein
MKRLPIVALFALTLPACAQRGGTARGGSAGHAAPAFHGSFGAPAAHVIARPLYRSPIAAAPSRYRRPYRPPYRPPLRFVSPYVTPYVAPIWAGPVAYGYDPTYDDSAPAQPPLQSELAPQPDGVMPPPPAEIYRPNYQPAPPPPSAVTQDEEPTTLIFKDGRPPLQIKSYVMSRIVLHIFEPHRDISLDDLDLARTTQVNREAGIDFHLPTLD